MIVLVHGFCLFMAFREKRRDSGRPREKDRRPRDEMDWEDGYGQRPESREHEGQRARSGGPVSPMQEEREKVKDKEGGGKREASAPVDVGGERRAEKVSKDFEIKGIC